MGDFKFLFCVFLCFQIFLQFNVHYVYNGGKSFNNSTYFRFYIFMSWLSYSKWRDIYILEHRPMSLFWFTSPETDDLMGELFRSKYVSIFNTKWTRFSKLPKTEKKSGSVKAWVRNSNLQPVSACLREELLCTFQGALTPGKSGLHPW